MSELRVHVVQSELIWENAVKNKKQFEEKIAHLQGKSDLIILPEMFTTGFAMNPSLAETMGGQSIQWLNNQAQKLESAICGSIIIEENDSFYNRMIFMLPSGEYEYYDKKHLFSMAKEDEVFNAGNQQVIIDYKGFKIYPLICYDLRFPVWSRNTQDYDILIYSANFPAKRSYAWKQLLIARAIENQSYVIGCNIVGKDGNDIDYSGDSCIIDEMGKVRQSISFDEGIIHSIISKKEIDITRKKLPFLNDRDDFNIIN